MMARNRPLLIRSFIGPTATKSPKLLADAVEDDEGFAGHVGVPSLTGPPVPRFIRSDGRERRGHRRQKTKVPITLMRADLALRKPRTLTGKGLVQARDEPGDRELVEGDGHGDE